MTLFDTAIQFKIDHPPTHSVDLIRHNRELNKFIKLNEQLKAKYSGLKDIASSGFYYHDFGMNDAQDKISVTCRLSETDIRLLVEAFPACPLIYHQTESAGKPEATRFTVSPAISSSIETGECIDSYLLISHYPFAEEDITLSDGNLKGRTIIKWDSYFEDIDILVSIAVILFTDLIIYPPISNHLLPDETPPIIHESLLHLRKLVLASDYKDVVCFCCPDIIHEMERLHLLEEAKSLLPTV